MIAPIDDGGDARLERLEQSRHVAAYVSSGVKWPDCRGPTSSPSVAPRDCQRWRWASTNPGRTIVSAASTTSALRARSAAPTSLMIPSSISTSASTRVADGPIERQHGAPLISTFRSSAGLLVTLGRDLIVRLSGQGVGEISPVAGKAVGMARWRLAEPASPASARVPSHVSELVHAADPAHATSPGPS